MLIDELDSLSVIPIDSGTLTELFHSRGVNMCYLGVVAEQASLCYVKELCEVEMLSRTLKNLIKYYLISNH